jgi:hypothetical protein
MRIVERLRNRPPRRAGDPGPVVATSADDNQLPIPGYDRLDHKQVTEQPSQLSQVELAAVEAYERAHGGRRAVLDKLRYMRGREPLPGYDTLSPEEITGALAGADAGTVKDVRDYERKFAHRRKVMEEAARVLPTAPASAREARAREEKGARVREGFASRARPARGVAADRPAPPQHGD